MSTYLDKIKGKIAYEFFTRLKAGDISKYDIIDTHGERSIYHNGHCVYTTSSGHKKYLPKKVQIEAVVYFLLLGGSYRAVKTYEDYFSGARGKQITHDAISVVSLVSHKYHEEQSCQSAHRCLGQSGPKRNIRLPERTRIIIFLFATGRVSIENLSWFVEYEYRSVWGDIIMRSPNMSDSNVFWPTEWRHREIANWAWDWIKFEV